MNIESVIGSGFFGRLFHGDGRVQVERSPRGLIDTFKRLEKNDFSHEESLIQWIDAFTTEFIWDIHGQSDQIEREIVAGWSPAEAAKALHFVKANGPAEDCATEAESLSLRVALLYEKPDLRSEFWLQWRHEVSAELQLGSSYSRGIMEE